MSRTGLVMLKEIERGVVSYEKALEILRSLERQYEKKYLQSPAWDSASRTEDLLTVAA
jgi:hypothetical protein